MSDACRMVWKDNERLRAEIERLKDGRDTMGSLWANEKELTAKLRAEVERLNMALEMFMRDEKTAAQNVRMLRAEVERLQAERSTYHDNQWRQLKETRAEVKRLRDLVRCLIENDPDEQIADNGMTVLDQWRKDARRALEGK